MGELATLAELQVADVAHVGLRASVGVLVLLQILGKIEVLGAVSTRESFLDVVLLVVTFQGKLGLESLRALAYVADEHLLRLLVAVLPAQECALLSC